MNLFPCRTAARQVRASLSSSILQFPACYTLNHHESYSSSSFPPSSSQAPPPPLSAPSPNSPLTSSSSPLPSKPKTIFSGIQPTGIPHLGNYLGALQQWVKLQDESREGDKLFFSVVDLHAITVKQDREQLRQWKREMLASLLAVGLRVGGEGVGVGKGKGDVTLFHQSQVPAHSELMWILSCTASMGYLSRMTQWKSKLSLKSDASPTDEASKSKLKLGLFSYPVLQAADVLVHRATHVPVGEDQSQHLEFARECVTNFNSAYGSHLVAPETILSPAKRVMSLQDPNQKMSKSHPDPKSRIMITNDPQEILQKVMSALTDSTNSVSYDSINRRGVSNLLELLSHFDSEGRSAKDLGSLYEGMGLKKFKTLVAEKIAEGMDPVRKRFDEVLKEDQGRYLDYVAEIGAKKARESAEETMAIVREAIGL